MMRIFKGKFAYGLFFIIYVFISLIGALSAQGRPLEAYYARLSAQDHFNSRGQRLTDVAAIIRQDRANFHVMRAYKDSEDEHDSFFAKKANRNRLEKLVSKSRITKAAKYKIINETPLIYVEIYDNHINIAVIED